ncbi:hypothetical protein [Phytomonospora endophytica]|uniref:Uncharacterized protein n=1 Tax=Phytomonospora endophytica TaxID=714109 RepID=A0A841FC86_9ACTN|nr:hypothetical protein [Phytomonospora endophytica]MBB6034901.1 hypothetical protein [Phytomonospora endophytica]GIG70605.1 hypothetical protein Pen01_69000 [Phytomonospora endophytica]
MSITATAPVLNGRGDSLLRLDGDELYVNLPLEDHRIPLEAIASVRAEGRSVSIVLTAATGTERDRTADGAALVTSRRYPVDVERIKHRRRLIGAAVGIVVVNVALALPLFLTGHGWFVLLFGIPGIIGTLLAARVYLLLPDALRLWRLPKHGITVDAVYSHIDGKGRAVYTYVDVDGTERMFMAGILLPRMGVEHFAVSYDARNPRHVVRTVDNGRGSAAFGLVLASAFAFVCLVAATGGSLAIAFGQETRCRGRLWTGPGRYAPLR